MCQEKDRRSPSSRRRPFRPSLIPFLRDGWRHGNRPVAFDGRASIDLALQTVRHCGLKRCRGGAEEIRRVDASDVEEGLCPRLYVFLYPFQLHHPARHQRCLGRHGARQWSRDHSLPQDVGQSADGDRIYDHLRKGHDLVATKRQQSHGLSVAL